jgi:hypothetical protein
MFIVRLPNKCVREQRYILSVLLSDFLGINYEATIYEGDEIVISMEGNKQELRIDASFFKFAEDEWLHKSSLPVIPLQTWDIAKDGMLIDQINHDVPVLFGKPGLNKAQNCWCLNLDIFGSAFFMLSRYEEVIASKNDEHDRFPATESVSYKANFLDRPLVNEYLEILWWCIQELWGGHPDVIRKNRKFRKLISCDVDHPLDHAGYSLKRTVLRIAARLLRDKNPKLAFSDALNYAFKRFGSDYFDGYRNNIDWMMKVNDRVGNKVAFYFIPIQTDKKREDKNDIRDPKISSLLKHIIASGHEVGFHPGYNTYNNADNFNKSADALFESLDNKLIDRSFVGGRQHYLKYDIYHTPQLWGDYGFQYDSSLGFADQTGFRCGVCFEYNMYDLVERKKMVLKQRPLIAMDCSIISEGYEGLGVTSKAKARFKVLENICKKYDGDYTLLWHNSFFNDVKSKELYLELISD